MQKINYLIFAFASTLFLAGCGNSSLMTEALDPFSGNQEKIRKWRDVGGLNADGGNTFFGIQIESVSYSFANGNEPNRMRRIEARTQPAESPAKIRKALSKACRVSESDFEITKSGVGGIAKNNDITLCSYEDGYIIILRGTGL